MSIEIDEMCTKESGTVEIGCSEDGKWFRLSGISCGGSRVSFTFQRVAAESLVESLSKKLAETAEK